MATSPETSDVGRSSGPVSSQSTRTAGTNLSNDQSKDKIDRLLSSTPPGTSTTRKSTCSLPYEIVEMIIAHLTRDLDALKACSLTCRSWCIAAVPRIHHTLTLLDNARDESRYGLNPLSALHGLGLASLIKGIRVSGRFPEWGAWFVPQAFSPDDLRHFSAFANVQTLKLEAPEIHSFVPGVECYFGHLSPTLRSIDLWRPHCTPRQLSYFLSLFPNLDNVNIYSLKQPSNTTTPDTELVPFSAPKLRGRLELYDFDWVETWTDLITSCGGLRFHYMDLCWVGGCVPFLLGACAETLETLECSLTGTDSSSLLPEFDLSQLKVLQSLRIGDWVTRVDVENRHTMAMDVFSTITSPIFSELVVVVDGDEISDIASDFTFFDALRMMKEVRPFKLVFSSEFLPSLVYVEQAQRRLVEALDRVNAEGLLDFLDSPSTIR